MPSATGDAKTLSSDHILDLRGLVEPDLTIIDVTGREWPIAADLPLRTAVALLAHAQAWESGELTTEAFNSTVDGMWAVLRRGTAGCTRDEVIDAFSVSEMIAAISFLSLRLRARAESPNGDAPAPSTSTETTGPAATPQRTRLPKRSAQASS